jgi:hypothetical protein
MKLAFSEIDAPLKTKIPRRSSEHEPTNHSKVENPAEASFPDLEPAIVPDNFRRLDQDEVVARGDFVKDEVLGLQPWEGPAGFRANAFLKPIYRARKKNPPIDITMA